MHRIVTGILVLLVLFLAADGARLRHRYRMLEERPAAGVVRTPLPASAPLVGSEPPDPAPAPPVSKVRSPAPLKAEAPLPPPSSVPSTSPATIAPPPVPAGAIDLPNGIQRVMTFVLQEKGIGGLDLTEAQKAAVDAAIVRRDEQVAALQNAIRGFEVRAEEEILQSLTPAQREKYLAQKDRPQEVTIVQDPVAAPASAAPPSGFLGIQGSDAAGGGVTFTNIFPDTAASAAGLQAGDVLLEFNNEKIADYASLSARIRAQPAGSPVNLKIRRNGAEFTQAVLLGTRR